MKKIIIIIIMFLILTVNVEALEEVKTVDNKDIGITINLFDYDIPDSSSNSPRELIDEQFNSLSPLKFYGQGGDEYYEDGNRDNFTGSNAVRQGIVKNTLQNGYPVLQTGESLEYLFNDSENEYKKVYTNVKNLFVPKALNTYYFDSNDYYAYYDPSQKDNGRFVLYTPTFKLKNTQQSEEAEILYTGFFPFDKYDSTKNDVSPKEDLSDPSKGYNHHFGMSIEAKVTIPKDKKIDSNDMIFTFSGDDDIWIFLDDVLVLDLGGIHLPTTGSLNITTGAVSLESAYALEGVETMGTSNTLESLFAKAGKELNLKDNTTHTIKVFYLERGGVFSNLSIETNFWQDVNAKSLEPPSDKVEGIKTKKEKNPNTTKEKVMSLYLLLIILIPIVIIIKKNNINNKI